MIENNSGNFYSNGEPSSSRSISNERSKSFLGGDVTLKATLANSGKCKVGDEISVSVDVDNASKMVFEDHFHHFFFERIILFLFFLRRKFLL